MDRTVQNSDMRGTLQTLLHLPERFPVFKWVAIGLAVIVGGLVAISPWYGIYVRDDESLPQYSFFLLRKGVIPQRGDLVAFEMTQVYADRVHPSGYQRPYARVGRLWLKEAYGVAGDEVVVEGRSVTVHGRAVATVVERDFLKQPVEPAQFVSPIPEGQYYLGLPHPRSFDSRVIGYVGSEDIKGVVWPIF
ncbi:MAG: S26 family signal peptidase [Nitrospirota bacterium]